MHAEPTHRTERLPAEVTHVRSELIRVSDDPYRDAVDRPYYETRLARLLEEADKRRT